MGKHTRRVRITHKYTVIDLKSYYFRKEVQSLTETDTCTECKESRNPQVSHCSPVPVLTLQDRRGVTGKGALLAECGAPGTREGGKVDVRLRRWAAVHWLTTQHTVPHSMHTNQLCFRLRRGEDKIHRLWYFGKCEHNSRLRTCEHDFKRLCSPQLLEYSGILQNLNKLRHVGSCSCLLELL